MKRVIDAKAEIIKAINGRLFDGQHRPLWVMGTNLQSPHLMRVNGGKVEDIGPETWTFLEFCAEEILRHGKYYVSINH
jgi:hypothetical protein